jgi:predicted nucleic acid-binding protein
MNPDQAWRAYRVLRSDWRIGYLTEPNELREEWDLFTQSRLTSPNLWTDAYLCAFASVGRLTLVTFDSKIPAWENVKCLVLSGGS